MELIGLYLIAAGLLVVAGVAKAAAARRHGPRHGRAWRRDRRRSACCGGPSGPRALAEAALGAVAVVLPRPGTALLVALSYVCFFGVVGYARWRGGPLATCGCFGRPDTPPTVLHMVLNVALAAAAAAVALGAPGHGTLATQLAHQPWAGFPLLFVERGGAVAHRAGPLRAGGPHRGPPAGPPPPGTGFVSLSTTLVARTARVLEGRLSRRSLINRSAFVGSAVAVGSGLDLALKPGTAYGAICECGNAGCGCGSTCCAGFSEFCCDVSGANYCPENTVMGGWWVADNSSYCGGPRYYMDCNSTCTCDSGCGGGFGFCEPGCDQTGCGCGPLGCDSYLTGCLQFRYGQCNQDVACIGRIVCRVVACVPPWTVDPSCTTAVAVDNSTAEQNEPCWTPAPPMPPCTSAATMCQVVGLAPSADGDGYAVLTSFGRLFDYGDFPNDGDASGLGLDAPIVAMATCKTGGYFLAAADGGIFDYGGAPFLGSMGGRALDAPVVGMAASPSGQGYWLVASDGGIFDYGDALFYGSMGGQQLNAPVVGMAATRSGRGILAGRRRRGHLHLRRRRVPRVDGRAAPERPGRRHRRDALGPGLLARRRRRGHLRLRRRRVRRVDRCDPPQQAGGRHRPVRQRRRLLAGGPGRWDLRLRRCPLPRVTGMTGRENP